ncbi:MAG TPA: hypothetical protein VE591_15010 [Candidatus Acidoferrum sp.]|nr:hypothetical protein [Candidatus Acidoferrum sp.]
MPRSSFTRRAASSALVTLALGIAMMLLGTRPASAIPIFAQRYGLQCSACHSVLPELNQFGTEFRNHGYRIEGLPKHGTTYLGLREQLGYTRDPGPGAERFVPAGAILGAAEVGHVEAFLHETLGSEGGPASLFLGYLATYDPHSKTLFRLGLTELPLVHSPAQRLDTLEAYGYEGNRVGLNDLTLATPRWGLEAERNVGNARIAATISVANSSGSAYGGPPVVTGENAVFHRPEYGVFTRFPISNNLGVGLDLLNGSRSITEVGRPMFNDDYTRGGLWVEATRGRLELLAEQYVGHDTNGDGLGDAINSRGGYARLRWALGSHAYIGVREDAAATPAETRALEWYAEALVARHFRVLIEQRRPIPGGPTSLAGALTTAIPWPWGK